MKKIRLTENKTAVILTLFFLLLTCVIFWPQTENGRMVWHAGYERFSTFIIILMVSVNYYAHWGRVSEVLVTGMNVALLSAIMMSQPILSCACFLGGIVLLLYIVMRAVKQVSLAAVVAILYSVILFTAYKIIDFGLYFSPLRLNEIYPYIAAGICALAFIGLAWKLKKVCEKNAQLDWEKFADELMEELAAADCSPEKPSEEMMQLYNEWKECAAALMEWLTETYSEAEGIEVPEDAAGLIREEAETKREFRAYEELIKVEDRLGNWENAEKIYSLYVASYVDEENSLQKACRYLNAACLGKGIYSSDHFKHCEMGMRTWVEEMQHMQEVYKEGKFASYGGMTVKQMVELIRDQEQKLQYVFEEEENESL